MMHTFRSTLRSAGLPHITGLGLLLLVGCADAASPINRQVEPPLISGSSTAGPLTGADSSPTNTAGPTVESSAPGAPAGSDGYQVEVTVDILKQYPISPWIYGVAASSSDNEQTLQELGVTVARWGGNARTRHNWEINASNAGGDWYYTNVSQGDSVPGSASLQFMQRNQRLGALSILTIPTIGWVARDSESQSIDVPEQGGPPISEGSDIAFTRFVNGAWSMPYDPAANRERTSLQSFPSKDGPYEYPPDQTDGKVYQDEWVAYLLSQRLKDAPPPIYAMDNEPELWSDSTHVDVHPVRLGYDAQLENFLTYARAIKKVDPDGLIAGPESWGVTAYLYSALDEGGDNYSTAADRAAHDGMFWLPWFLKSAADADAAFGQRSLDILDVRYYPSSGAFRGGNDPEMQDIRMQAPRALWDVNYVEPSWVARTEWANLALTRRLQRLIEQYYPGTKLGISEWNFGGEDDISGAIATADTLGIFGREQVYSAAYWGLPEANSPVGRAFQLYRNYDGKGSSFGSQSVGVSSTNTTQFSAYAALADEGEKLTIILINKSRDSSSYATIKTPAFVPGASSTEYTFGRRNLNEIVAEPLASQGSETTTVTLPPLSITLLVLDR